MSTYTDPFPTLDVDQIMITLLLNKQRDNVFRRIHKRLGFFGKEAPRDPRVPYEQAITEFGINIRKEYYADTDISVDDLAREYKITPPTIYKILKGLPPYSFQEKEIGNYASKNNK